MRKYLSVTLGLLTLALLVEASQNGQSGAAGGHGTLRVHVRYAGSGTVDASHKIYVAVWESPDFVQPNSPTRPIAVKPLTAKDGTAAFTDLSASPVYVSVAYDPKGEWDASKPPPAGSSLGMYSKAPPTPEAVNLEQGKPAHVEVRFDDQVKVH